MKCKDGYFWFSFVTIVQYRLYINALSMIAVVSPAKTIDESPIVQDFKSTKPHFGDKADYLVGQLKKLGVDELTALYKVNRSIGELNFARFFEWGQMAKQHREKAAIFAFNGEVYRGFDVKTLGKSQLESAQLRIRMLSGLYGLLKPFDAVKPYRLEMGTAWGPDATQSLYPYWRNDVTQRLSREIGQSSGDKVLVNLASAEYFKVIDTKKLARPILHIDFKQEEDGKLKNITVYAKKARGMMARFIAVNELNAVEDLKAFCDAGYYFSAPHSSENKWMFVR
jgi:cytoplasmic iron level regulating protein YaaA (DUF328/UPF0246 family)